MIQSGVDMLPFLETEPLEDVCDDIQRAIVPGEEIACVAYG